MTVSLDLDRLSDWLHSNLEGYAGMPTVDRFAGGQSNPTYLLSRPAGGATCCGASRPAKLLPSAHAVDREYRVMRALADSGVPVPRVHLLCEDATVIGSAFYVMEYVDGPQFRDPALPGMSRRERAAIYDEMNRVIAALHGVDYRAAGLAGFGRPGQYLKRQIERWTKQYRASETEPIDAMERLIEWLPAHIPEADETSLVHGDFRIDNLIFHPHEPRVRGGARLGTVDARPSARRLRLPLHDVARDAGRVPRAEGPRPGRAGHSGRSRLRAGLLPAQRPGAIADWDYYMAFNMFRMAAILQGILQRALQGNAACADALETGHLARPIAEAGWRQAVSTGKAQHSGVGA